MIVINTEVLREIEQRRYFEEQINIDTIFQFQSFRTNIKGDTAIKREKKCQNLGDAPKFHCLVKK